MKPKLSPLEAMCEAYWNAFRDGFIRVGGNPKDYPTWAKSTDPVKQETIRCMRHAVAKLEDVAKLEGSGWPMLFPEPAVKRSLKPIPNDADFVRSQKIAKFEGRGDLP